MMREKKKAARHDIISRTENMTRVVGKAVRTNDMRELYKNSSILT